MATRDLSPVRVVPSADVEALIQGLPLARDRCSTRVRAQDVEAAWKVLFGQRERTDLTVEELAGRVETAAAALTQFRSEHAFMRLPVAEYVTLEKDALGPRALPLARYEAFAANLLAASGSRALYSVTRPTATPDPQLGLIQDIMWNETKPVQEKRVGDNRVARATMLSSLQQLSLVPPGDLRGSVIAFVGINAPDQGGSTTAPGSTTEYKGLVMVDVVKGATDGDATVVYNGRGPEGQVAAHEIAHLMSSRVCGEMVDANGTRVDPLFTSLVPGFPFTAQAEASLGQSGLYRGWSAWDNPRDSTVAVGRAYGARNPEEAQAVLNGELLMDSRFSGRVYAEVHRANVTESRSSSLCGWRGCLGPAPSRTRTTGSPLRWPGSVRCSFRGSSRWRAQPLASPGGWTRSTPRRTPPSWPCARVG
ncbi:hypothetical protein [Terrabacter sp. 2YAF2]|uniref:hypothetical protein n=1 Tax=Terrabacter sp. 2YAF2 TaxID=3233026 RepID=UPI003F977968